MGGSRGLCVLESRLKRRGKVLGLIDHDGNSNIVRWLICEVVEESAPLALKATKSNIKSY